jgi:hypothetical protein
VKQSSVAHYWIEFKVSKINHLSEQYQVWEGEGMKTEQDGGIEKESEKKKKV